MKKFLLALTRKEQQIFFVGGVVFLLVILLVLNSTLQGWKQESILYFDNNHKLLLNVQQSLKLKSQVSEIDKISINNISSTVSSVARSFNLTIDRIQPSSEGEIMVSVNQTEFVNLYEWLRELDLSKGIAKFSNSNLKELKIF